ncbi:MAG: LamG domain-containing protein [Methylotenera sp.]|nr:LamG domain-containing protein [Oligoflexia bacterium]
MSMRSKVLNMNRSTWTALLTLVFALALTQAIVACDPLEGTPVTEAAAESKQVSGVTFQADQYRLDVLNDNPDGYWRLGEADVAEAAKDETLGAHNGTYHSSAIVGVPGPILADPSILSPPSGSGSLGTTPVVQLPNSVSIAANTSSALEFWVNISSSFYTGSVTIASWGGGATNLSFDATTKILSAQVTDDLAQAAALPLNFSLDLDQWVHLVWVITPQISGGGVQKLYMNGQLAAQGPLAAGGSPWVSGLVLGGGATDAQAYFSVSELALFSGVNIPAADAWLSRYHLAGY